MSELSEITKQIPSLRDKAKYWFVRTEGGSLYKAFIATSSIAFGYRGISLDFLKKLTDSDEDKEKLKTQIRKKCLDNERSNEKGHDQSGLAASQLMRFCFEIKKDDIVLIPSERSSKIGIGIVRDKTPYEEVLASGDKTYTEFTKRRKIKWLTTIERKDLNPNLIPLIWNPQAIVEASEYSHWIDPGIHKIFRKGEAHHFVLEVNTQENLRAIELFGACVDLLRLVDEFAQASDIEADVDLVETRVNLNSPGDVEFWVASGQTILVLATFTILLIPRVVSLRRVREIGKVPMMAKSMG